MRIIFYNMIVRIRVILVWVVDGFVSNLYRPSITSVFYLNPITSIFTGNKVSLNRICCSLQNYFVWLIRIRPPLSAVSTSATKFHMIWRYCSIRIYVGIEVY